MIVTTVLLALLACGQTTSGTDEAARELSPQVAKLVRQLDASQLAEREAAERGLVELGPEVLDLLPPVTPRTSAEVKERLGRVRKVLELAAARSAVEATTVTLAGKMTVTEVLQKLAAQTGNTLAEIEDRDQEITVDFRQTPFWQALDTVLDQGDLTINIYGGHFHALTVSARPNEQRRRSQGGVYAGLFRLEATRLEAVRDLRNPDIQGLKVGLEVSWEPRLTPISIGQDIEQLEVLDEEGKPLEVDSRQALFAPVEADISAVELVLPLELPRREVKRIGAIKGKLAALLPGRTEVFQFDDLSRARDVEQRRAGVTVAIEQVRRNQDLTEVRMHVRFDNAANALESHRGWVFNNEALLHGPGGEVLEPASYQTTHQGQEEVGMAYLFDVPQELKGYKFVYKTPASILRTSIPYEIKDVPLP